MTFPIPELSAHEANLLANIDTLVDEFSIPRDEATLVVRKAIEVLDVLYAEFAKLETLNPIHRRVLIKTLVIGGLANWVQPLVPLATLTLHNCARAYSEDQSHG